MSQDTPHAHRTKRFWRGWRILLGAWLLVLLAIYAPVWGVPLLHDDGLLVWPLRHRHVFGSAIGDPIFRPLAYFPWQITRLALGWYESAPIHFFNVAAHLVNTLLVFQLVRRLNRAESNTRDDLTPAFVAAVLFGGHPLFNQALLWASALVHPLLTLFGLGAAHAYLSARAARAGGRRYALLGIAAVLALGGCLSNEAGFMGALWVGLVELYLAWRASPRRVWWAVGVPLLVAAAYLAIYRALFNTNWSQRATIYGLEHPLEAVGSALYLAQGLIMPVIVMLRPWLGLDEHRYLTVALLFGASLIGLLVLLARAKRLALGLLGLSWWAVSTALFAGALEHSYVLYAPRLTYAPMVGGVLLLSSALSPLVQHARLLPRLLGVLALAAWTTWSASYINTLAEETSRLLPAMRAVDEDLRRSAETETVLLINPPLWSAPAVPLLLLGTEGMPIASPNAAPDLWLGAMSGTYRRTVALRHDISLTQAEGFRYGILGDFADDGALRAALLKSNRVYRFDYDPPRGLRARRLAVLKQADPPTQWLALFCRQQACVALIAARWQQCWGDLTLELTWQSLSPLHSPTAVFVHGLDEAGAPVWVADRDLVDGYLPLEVLPAEVRLTESRVLPSLEAHPSLRQVSLGIYDRQSVERFEATLGDGSKASEVRLVLPMGLGCDGAP